MYSIKIDHFTEYNSVLHKTKFNTYKFISENQPIRTRASNKKICGILSGLDFEEIIRNLIPTYSQNFFYPNDAYHSINPFQYIYIYPEGLALIQYSSRFSRIQKVV